MEGFGSECWRVEVEVFDYDWVSEVRAGVISFFFSHRRAANTILRLWDKLVEILRRTGSGPENLNSVREAAVIAILRNVSSPTEFVGDFSELNGGTVDTTTFLHLEIQDFLDALLVRSGSPKIVSSSRTKSAQLLTFGSVGPASNYRRKWRFATPSRC